MPHFAQVQNGIVVNVLEADQAFINSGEAGDFGEFIETCPETHANTHPRGTPLRKNFGNIGYVYDAVRDAFIPPQPYPSWHINEDTCQWDPPVPRPPEHPLMQYIWDESSINWKCSCTEQEQRMLLGAYEDSEESCKIYPFLDVGGLRPEIPIDMPDGM